MVGAGVVGTGVRAPVDPVDDDIVWGSVVGLSVTGGCVVGEVCCSVVTVVAGLSVVVTGRCVVVAGCCVVTGTGVMG